MPEEIIKGKIICVDDDPNISRVIKMILEKEGFNIKSLNSGQEALERIKTEDFDLMLSDIMMPDMTGLELAGYVQKIKPSLKIIFLSSVEVSEQRLKELSIYNIKDYILKPFKNTDLIERIKKVLES